MAKFSPKTLDRSMIVWNESSFIYLTLKKTTLWLVSVQLRKLIRFDVGISRNKTLKSASVRALLSLKIQKVFLLPIGNVGNYWRIANGPLIHHETHPEVKIMCLTTDFPWLLSHFVEMLHPKQSNDATYLHFLFCKHHFSNVKVQSGTTRRSARYYNLGSRSTYNSFIHSLNMNRFR